MNYLIIFLLMALPMAAQPLIVAHRGASVDAPENTLAAFNLAWELGADAIEADFRLTRDRRLICIHDPSTSDVASDIRNVAETNWDALRQIDVGSWKDKQFTTERMPSLTEVLSTVPDGKMAFIELKEDRGLVDPFLQELKQTGFPLEQLLVISFEPAIIKGIEAKQPEIQTGLIVSFRVSSTHVSPSMDALSSLAKQVGADAVNLSGKGLITAENVKKLKAEGLGVHIWTIDSPGVAQYLAAIGVDSITTNTPGKLREGFLQMQQSPR